MTIVEYFSFLPYGKYAFYVWLAYGVATLTVIFLFISARRNHNNTLNSLKNNTQIEMYNYVNKCLINRRFNITFK